MEGSRWQFVRNDANTGTYTKDDIGCMLGSAFTVHLKPAGYLCNAVGRSIASGTPVLMDTYTFQQGLYENTGVEDGVNAIIRDSWSELAEYLETVTDEEVAALRLSTYDSGANFRRFNLAEYERELQLPGRARLWRFPT